MSLDVRTRARSDVRTLDRAELVDSVLAEASRTHGTLAARGLAVLDPEQPLDRA